MGPAEGVGAFGGRGTLVAQGKRWRLIVVLAIDGAAVPTRPEAAKGGRPGRKHKRTKRARWQGHWREAKGFRFYLAASDRMGGNYSGSPLLQ
jgi:hypothetical protein